MEGFDDYDDIELEEMEKSYPQYDDMNYDDLTTNLGNLERKMKEEAMYGSDPLTIVDLKSELDYVKIIMERRAIEETTFTEGKDGTVNISGPSGSTTVPGVEFVEDPDGLLPDVLDVFDDSFDAEWKDIEERLEKLKKFSGNRLTAEEKRNFENQVERVQAVVEVIKGKEKLLLDPKNKYVRELIKRSSVKTLKDGTEVLMFRSERGIEKGGTQIMKRGKTSKLVYSKNSPALGEYKDLLKKIKEIRTDSDTRTEGGELNPDVSDITSRITASVRNFEEINRVLTIQDEIIASMEYARRENIELIDIGEQLGDIPGLTIQENNELRGVLNPPETSNLEGRTGPEGALQIQSNYFTESISETLELLLSSMRNEISRLVGVYSNESDLSRQDEITRNIGWLNRKAGSVIIGKTPSPLTEYSDEVLDPHFKEEYTYLTERTDALREARDRTLNQRVLEEARGEQLQDISRLRRFIDWVGKEKVGLTGVAVSTAGLITALLIHARGAIVGTAKATGKVAKALANIAKKAAPILVPILNGIATALSWGAKGVAWLASNLWVLAVAIAFIIYDYNTK